MKADRILNVATTGNDRNPGTTDQPFATLARARDAIREWKGRAEPITVLIRGGTYYLPETLVFSAQDSGTQESPVTYTAAAGATVVLSGGVKLALAWEPPRGAIRQAAVPLGLVIDQLFLNGQRLPMARYPNFDPDVLVYNGFAADAISPERVARWADPTSGFLHAMHQARWGGFHYRITGKRPDGSLAYEGGWQNNRPAPMHKQHRFVENIAEELDAPGEWFYNPKESRLYLWPPEGVELDNATLEAARLPHLIEFRGDSADPVRFLNLKGLTFRHTVRTFMENKEPILRTDWTIYRGGAVLYQGAEDCSISDCTFDQVGGNALFVNAYNRRLTIERCRIEGAGANAIAFVGGMDAVRVPIGWRDQGQFAYDTIDRTPGPKTDNFPADCLVADCLISRAGRVEKQSTGVEIDIAQRITVRHCTIHDMPRAGINIGDGCFGGHVIEFCDVFDTVKETGDHGSFNSWGRDRFWGLKGWDRDRIGEEAYLAATRLDMVEPSILRNNRWRCDHGWDVDLDDGSSNYQIVNNLFLHGGLKLREGFSRTVRNNITVNNSLHPHVWYKGSRDVVTGNIFMGAYRPAAMRPDLNLWGERVDRNLFTTSEADRDKFAGKGCDAHSLVGDPKFLDPERGDYRVAEDSPARAIGFENFPMDRFGVQYPPLRRIAPTPELPRWSPRGQAVEAPEPRFRFLGATVKNLTGLEYSAVGVAADAGGVLILDVPAGSIAARAGLEPGDLIRHWDGQPTPTVADLARLLATTGNQPARLTVRHNQQDNPLTLPPPHAAPRPLPR